MASNWYRYKPLASEDSFRLFRLKTPQPCLASAFDRIELELFEASLDRPPEFEAISYAWGQEQADSTLSCNGLPLQVTSNVISILRELQQKESVGVLWIDTICIDQNSIPEKNMQVPRMRSIYQKALHVWIWLGRGTCETEAAFELFYDVMPLVDQINSVRERVKQYWIHFKQFHDAYTSKISAIRGVYDAVDTDFIVDVLNLPWFHRTWTVQEQILSKEAKILCGSVCISWDSFMRVLYLLQLYVNRVQVNDEGYRSNPASFYDDVQFYNALENPGNLKYGLDRRDTPISMVLGLLRGKMSSEMRDKVYGLYGIFDQMGIRDLPPVDYSKSIDKVYTEIATAALRIERCPNILYHVCLPSLIPNLPSWVPDWSNNAFIQAMASLTWNYRASKWSKPFHSVNGRKLTVTGILIDELRKLGNSTSFCSENFRRGYKVRTELTNILERHRAMIELIRTLKAWLKLSREFYAYPGGEADHEIFYMNILNSYVPENQRPEKWTVFRAFPTWKTLIALRSGDNLQTVYKKAQTMLNYWSVKADFIALLGFSADDEEWEDEIKIRLILKVYSQNVARFQHDIALVTYQRTIFTTRDGYIGIGPRWAKPNDSIALISGSKLPFVVRRVGRNFQLIGPAYINGIMKGERWDEDLLENITIV
ncbi:hypothetical protein CC78DRAFT_620568 [Lojkania enalia]|uniref:Heterokaryon incompatibility domain-containing protein n=1 Tax=Lojkania enalia TaxID=147567 RepID=A0A9P4K2F1_9PLEO|nr:hypothetical protein CC78DRAFT_620568 [Didymosphaeria enalia]